MDRTPHVIAYGPHERQRAWLRPGPAPGPLLLVVPGGGWVQGNPEGAFSRAAADWGHARGMHVATLSHRLLPAASPLDQAEDVARAMVAVRAAASGSGGDPDRVVLLAHSAGAHLGALVHVGALQPRVPELLPWCASVLLDTAALNVPQLMRWPHAPLHDRAFGADPLAWEEMSPLHQVRQRCAPLMLAVGQARPGALLHARRFVAALRELGGRADLHAVDLAHHHMADGLAEGGLLVPLIDRFLTELDRALPGELSLPSVARSHQAL